MTLEELLAEKIREAVHQALDERGENALPELYTLQQAADQYHGALKVKTLRALCKSGVLPHVRFSDAGPYYLTPEGIRTAIERCTKQPSSRPRVPRKAATKAL